MDLVIVFDFIVGTNEAQHSILVALAEANGSQISGGGSNWVFVTNTPIQLARFIVGMTVMLQADLIPLFVMSEALDESTENDKETAE